MATTFSSRASKAVLFMRRCRQLSHSNPQSRRASTLPSQIQYTRPSSPADTPYEPSNFSKSKQPRRSSPRVDSSSTDPSRTRRSLQATGESGRDKSAGNPLESLRASTPRPSSFWTSITRVFGAKPPANHSIPGYEPAPFNAWTNPYRARKQWPPDFSTLHPKEQFRFEKTYRRRAKLAYTRPAWSRKVKLVQHTLMVSTLIYFIFIAEPRDMGTPFDGFRVWFYGKLKDWTALPEGSREEAARLQEESRKIKDERARKNWFQNDSDGEKDENQDRVTVE